MRSMIIHIPNTLTILNILAGCLSIASASRELWDIAVVWIILATILDFLDGFAARLLNAYSSIGGQLDSLADMVSFGIAPAFLLYKNFYGLYAGDFDVQDHLLLSFANTMTIYLPFTLTVAAALRLAKFNMDTRQHDYFLGLPTPAMAIFFASSVYVFRYTPSVKYIEFLDAPVFWIILMLVFSLLMIAELKMFAIKFRNLSWSDNKFQYLFVGISVILLVLLQEISIPIIVVVYIVLSSFYHLPAL